MERDPLDDDKLLTYLRTLNPKVVQVSYEIRQWWENTALLTLKSQAMSELQRHDVFEPCLVGFMKDGSLGRTNVMDATGGSWGSRASKDATAFVHRIAAMIPGTHASVFCSEVWSLHGTEKKELDRNIKKYPNLGDHPDRQESVMFSMLHYVSEANTIMQLHTMVEVLKVLGEPRHPMMWAGTKFGEEHTVDPNDPKAGMHYKGRFVVGHPLDDKDDE